MGQLALDVHDSRNHLLVWRSIASKAIDKNAKKEKQQKELTNGVRKLLKNIPPTR